MEVVSNKNEMIFKSEHDGRVFYSVGVSKKNQDGKYENGYVPVRFKKDVELENKTKIRINTAWIDFYVKDKKTYPYIFICDFDIADEKKDPFEEYGQSITTKSRIEEQLQISESDFPF